MRAVTKIDALFAGIAPDAPGCAVGIVQNGKTILEKAYRPARTPSCPAVLIRFYRDSSGRITELSWGDNRMRDLRAARL